MSASGPSDRQKQIMGDLSFTVQGFHYTSFVLLKSSGNYLNEKFYFFSKKICYDNTLKDLTHHKHQSSLSVLK